MFTRFLTPKFIEDIRRSIDTEPRLMLRDLAERLGAPEGAVARALPQDMRGFAPASVFDHVWEAMTSWSAITFIAITPGLVLEFKGTLPKGSHGHGMFNLHTEGHPLGGHFMVARLGSICFLSKPFFGLESHSVQFYDQDGAVMCAVYAGRQGRDIVAEVREAFMALRDEVCTQEEEA
jgi:putative heme utilization carrier protein HutX